MYLGWPKWQSLLLWWGKGECRGPWSPLSVGLSVCSLCCHCGWWRGQNHGHPHGSEVMGPTHTAAPLPVAVGSSVTGARVTCATSSAAAGLFWSCGLKAPLQEAWNCGSHLCSFSISSICSDTGTVTFLTQGYVWISLATWCVGQRTLCWVMGVLLAAHWRGERKRRVSYYQAVDIILCNF